jgi:hypothetical protein
MSSRKPKTKPQDPAPARDGKTRPPEAALDPAASDSFDEVQPARFRGHSRSSIEAAVVDPDVEDSIGGE